jgi:hypothetical protein
MSTHDEGWSDFTHTTRTSKVSAQELFERYREFQSFIAELPRKELVARRWLNSVDDDSPLATLLGLLLKKKSESPAASSGLSSPDEAAHALP